MTGYREQTTTPETDPVTAARHDDPPAVATARTAARTAAHELAAIEGGALVGELVTPAELVEARAAVELTRSGVEAAIRQHAIDVEDARRAALAELAEDMRGAEPPDLAPLHAAVVTAVRAYREAAAEWTATVAGFTRRADELDAPPTFEHRADGYESPVRRIGMTADRRGDGTLVVDGVTYGWTSTPEGELLRAIDDGGSTSRRERAGRTLPARIPQPTRSAA